MWFKNLFIFQLTKSNFFPQINLEEQIKSFAFTECTGNQLSSQGWVSALPNTKNLVHSANNNALMLLRYQVETKILPAAFIKREVQKKVDALEAEQLRRAHKKEREQLHEDVIFQHLPHAFSDYKTIELYIDCTNEIVVIDASSRAQAEDILAALRKSIGTMPVTSYFDDHQIQTCLNEWIMSERDVPPALSIGDNIKVSGHGESKPITTFQNEDVFDKYIVNLIGNEGRDVDYLDLSFDGCFGMQLTTDGIIKKLDVYDVIKEQNDDIDSEDLLARVDADFVLFTGEISRLLHEFKELKLVEEVTQEPFDASTLTKTFTEEQEQDAA